MHPSPRNDREIPQRFRIDDLGLMQASIYTPELGIGVTFPADPLELKANAETDGCRRPASTPDSRSQNLMCAWPRTKLTHPTLPRLS